MIDIEALREAVHYNNTDFMKTTGEPPNARCL